MRITYKNDLLGYLSDWKICIDQLAELKIKDNESKSYSKIIPAINYDELALSIMLNHLDSKLTILESKPPIEMDYDAYAEGMVFIKAAFIFFRILLDDFAGLIRIFYKNNEGIHLPSSFSKLIKKLEEDFLPEDLSKVIEKAKIWFPVFKKRRDDIVHRYESILIYFKEKEKKEIKLDYGLIWSEKENRNLGDLREYLGYILKEYQILVDNLLDHFDLKFKTWYGLVRSQKSRGLTIIEGTRAYILWWAITYGNYYNPDIIIEK